MSIVKESNKGKCNKGTSNPVDDEKKSGISASPKVVSIKVFLY